MIKTLVDYDLLNEGRSTLTDVQTDFFKITAEW